MAKKRYRSHPRYGILDLSLTQPEKRGFGIAQQPHSIRLRKYETMMQQLPNTLLKLDCIILIIITLAKTKCTTTDSTTNINLKLIETYGFVLLECFLKLKNCCLLEKLCFFQKLHAQNRCVCVFYRRTWYPSKSASVVFLDNASSALERNQSWKDVVVVDSSFSFSFLCTLKNL